MLDSGLLLTRTGMAIQFFFSETDFCSFRKRYKNVFLLVVN